MAVTFSFFGFAVRLAARIARIASVVAATVATTTTVVATDTTDTAAAKYQKKNDDKYQTLNFFDFILINLSL